MGGIDWGGLGLAAAWLGIDDLDGLMHRLLAIKLHGGRKDDGPAEG